jgi:hypothetical protein
MFHKITSGQCTYLRRHGKHADDAAELGFGTTSPSMRLPFQPLVRSGGGCDGCVGIFFGGGGGGVGRCSFAARTSFAEGGCSGGVGPLRIASKLAYTETAARD